MKEQEIIKFLNDYKNWKCELREYNSCIECENKVKEAIQGLLDLYNKEKEKNKELENKIKKAIKEIERRMNLANECIEQEIVIADSDSLNYGRAQAHDVDSVLLKEILE